jgi:2'-5' RNA ligase
MAFIGLRLPPEVGRHLVAVDVPGERVDYGHAHVTISYLGDNTPVEEAMRAAAVLVHVAQQFKPIRCKTDKVDHFDAGDGGKYPIICPVKSPELHRFKTALEEALDLAGVEYDKKWPVFKPHTTLSFSEEPVESRAMPLLEWVSHEVVLWGGDDRDQGAVVEVPFSPSMAQRVAARVTSWRGF